MPDGRGSHTFIKEKITFNLARIKKGGEHFEVVLKDTDKALEYRRGKEVDIKDILETPQVWKDANKGEQQSSQNLQKWIGSSDPLEAAKIILRHKDTEISLTQEMRKKYFEAKKKKIIDYIHANACDPKTGLPHPVQRIELAMEQAKIHIDPYQPAEAQIEKIIQQLRPVIPISFEKAKIKVLIPAKYSGTAHSTIKNKFALQNENWKDDGSVSFEVEIAAGIKADFFSLVNKLTQGEATIEEVKK